MAERVMAGYTASTVKPSLDASRSGESIRSGTTQGPRRRGRGSTLPSDGHSPPTPEQSELRAGAGRESGPGGHSRGFRGTFSTSRKRRIRTHSPERARSRFANFTDRAPAAWKAIEWLGARRCATSVTPAASKPWEASREAQRGGRSGEGKRRGIKRTPRVRRWGNREKNRKHPGDCLVCKGASQTRPQARGFCPGLPRPWRGESATSPQSPVVTARRRRRADSSAPPVRTTNGEAEDCTSPGDPESQEEVPRREGEPSFTQDREPRNRLERLQPQ